MCTLNRRRPHKDKDLIGFGHRRLGPVGADSEGVSTRGRTSAMLVMLLALSSMLWTATSALAQGQVGSELPLTVLDDTDSFVRIADFAFSLDLDGLPLPDSAREPLSTSATAHPENVEPELVFWLSVEIDNGTEVDDWLLVQRLALISALDVWVVADGQVLMQADPVGIALSSPEAMPEFGRGFEIPLNLPSHQSATLVMRVAMAVVTEGPFMLVTAERLQRDSSWRPFLLTLVLGCFLALGIYHLSLDIRILDGRNVLLALSALTMGANWFFWLGGLQHLGGMPSPQLTEMLLGIAYQLVAAFMLLNSWLIVFSGYLSRIWHGAFALYSFSSSAVSFFFVLLTDSPLPLFIYSGTTSVIAFTLMAIAIVRRVPGWEPFTAAVIIVQASDLFTLGPQFFPETSGVGAWLVENTTALELATILTDFMAVAFLSFALTTRIRMIREQWQEASRASRQKSLFLATMSHEIRTPMTAMQSAAELLDRTPLSPDQRHYVRTFLKSGRLLSRLVDDVLDFSRYEGDGIALNAGRFDPGDAAAQTAALFDAAAQAKGLTLVTLLGPDLPERVSGDEQRFQQVLFNLISNAIKFTDHGQVKLIVVAEWSGADRAMLRIAVSDTGIGIPRGLQETVFKAFTQAEAGIGRRFGGSGLGLTIARSIVTAMGGTIALKSTPGRGTTVSCAIPFTTAAADPAAAAASDRTAPLSLLLVEDSPESRELIAALLQYEGHRVTAVASVDNALATLAAAQRHFDAVLTDIHLPGRSGIDLCRTLHASSDPALAHLPVIALTADAQATTAKACSDAGILAVLAKPIAIDDLNRRLGTLLHPNKRGQDSTETITMPAAAMVVTGQPPLIDVDRLEKMARRVGPGKLRRSVDLFLENAPDYNHGIETAIAKGDAPAARAAAHRLAGGAGALGLVALAAEARQLAHDDRDLPISPADSQSALQLFEPSLTALRDWIAERQSAAPDE